MKLITSRYLANAVKMHKEYSNVENILVSGKHYKELTVSDIKF